MTHRCSNKYVPVIGMRILSGSVRWILLLLVMLLFLLLLLLLHQAMTIVSLLAPERSMCVVLDHSKNGYM